MFAGDTLYAYPIIQHINATIGLHRKLLSRAMDLPSLKGHLLRVLNDTVSTVEDQPKGVDPTPIVEFIFAGFDWRSGEFQGWLFHYDRSLNRFTHRPMRPWSGGNEAKMIVISGDYQEEFKGRLVRILRSKGKISRGGFDMEPFEVLRDMLRQNNEFNCIGGPPQVMKIYPHMNCRPYAVRWPDIGSGTISFMGRMLMEYESHDFMTLDPDTLETTDA